MKLSTFIIGLVLVGLVGTVVGMYYADGASKYGANYTNNTLQQLDKINEIQSLSKELNESISSINPTEAGITDIVGGFISSGYTAVKVAFSSMGLFGSMSDAVFSNVPELAVFKIYLWIIAFIAFAFIVISILVQRDT